MTFTSALLVTLGAALGAPLRWLVSHLYDDRMPWGMLAVNVTGCGLIGWFSGLALSGNGWALLATGFCGSLTSYSSFAVQAVDLPRGRSAAYAAMTLAGCAAACWLGVRLGA